MKTHTTHPILFALIGLILWSLAVVHASPLGSEEVTPSEEQVGQVIHNVILRVVRVTPDWMLFASTDMADRCPAKGE